MPSCLFIAALWPSAGKELTSWLSLVCLSYFCYFTMSYPESGVVNCTGLNRFLIVVVLPTLNGSNNTFIIVSKLFINLTIVFMIKLKLTIFAY